MAHQWFGDKITCGSWKDIWLNEGFATYLASLVYENFDNLAAFVSDKTNMINSITAGTSGAVYLTDTEATDVNRIFSGRLTYNKGAMVLEMLRFKMGDTAFFHSTGRIPICAPHCRGSLSPDPMAMTRPSFIPVFPSLILPPAGISHSAVVTGFWPRSLTARFITTLNSEKNSNNWGILLKPIQIPKC